MGCRWILMVGVIILGGWLASTPTFAVLTPYDDVLITQAIRDLEQENYEEALEALTQAWEKGTHTPEKAYYLGVVYRRLLDYPKARKYLEEAVRLKPRYPQAQALLGDTLVALDRPELARPYLEDLEKTGYQPAQTAFLLGMAAVKQKRYDQALEYFHKAEGEPSLAQEAKLQASLVLVAQNRLKEARKNMVEAIALAPQTPSAGLAQRYATVLERRLKEIRPFRFYGSFGFDYDSNVTLNPGDPTTAQFVSGQGDAVYTYNAFLEYNFFPTGAFGLLSQYAVTQNFHPRLSKYDLLSHNVGLIPLYQTRNSRFWLPLSFSFTDVENDKYYTAFALAPSYLYLPTPKVGLEGIVRLARDYYWFPIGVPQDDRSGRVLGTSLGIYYFFTDNKEGYFQARLIYEHDFASGSNWENSNYRLFLLGVFPLTSRLKMSTFFDLSLQPYDHQYFDAITLTLQPKRRDKTFIFGANVTYTIYKGLEFNAHYYLVRDNSSVPLYDYIRHIVGCQLGFRY